MAVVWLAVTRPPIPSRIVSAAMTSTKREWSSSVSSQWMSTRKPLSAASDIANLTERSPYSRVSSKWGMAPTTSTPMSTARRIRSSPPSNDMIPCCGNATSCTDIDVAAHELDPVGELPPEHGTDAALDIVDGQVLDPLGPDGDALEQRPGLVVPRLADGEHGIEVDMGLDQRRRDQRSPQVDDLAGLGLGLGDPPVPDADLPRVCLPGDPGALQEQIEHRQEASRDLNFQRLGSRFVQGEGPCRRLRK